MNELKAELHKLVDDIDDEHALESALTLLKLYHGDYKGDKKWQGKQEKAEGKGRTN